MRMDIFNRLNEQEKISTIKDFVMIYGVEEFMARRCSVSNLMSAFDCGIDEHGNLYSPDDLWTLEELADECVVGYHAIDNGVRRGAFFNAMDNALVEYAKEKRPQMKTLAELSEWCEAMGIYFMDYDGAMIFVDII